MHSDPSSDLSMPFRYSYTHKRHEYTLNIPAHVHAFRLEHLLRHTYTYMQACLDIHSCIHLLRHTCSHAIHTQACVHVQICQRTLTSVDMACRHALIHVYTHVEPTHTKSRQHLLLFRHCSFWGRPSLSPGPGNRLPLSGCQGILGKSLLSIGSPTVPHHTPNYWPGTMVGPTNCASCFYVSPSPTH